MHYYTNVGPVVGPAFDRRVPPTIDVLKARDDAQPIGTALCVGLGDKGIALWRLIVHSITLPDRWIVVNRQFRPADLGAARPYRLAGQPRHHHQAEGPCSESATAGKGSTTPIPSRAPGASSGASRRAVTTSIELMPAVASIKPSFL
jgi:hypothetical protein